MIIMLFGVSNVGKTTAGRELARLLRYEFKDLDEEVRRRKGVTTEEFVSQGTIYDRDKYRGKVLSELAASEKNTVIAVTPMSNTRFFKKLLSEDGIIAVELQDTAENIFERLVFSDENDVVYHDDEYKNAHKSWYLSEIRKDQQWYGNKYKAIEQKYHMNGETPEETAQGLIDMMNLR